MSNSKNTKRALLVSVMAMVLCVAMLAGTTFAWFTDSATTQVSTIQAGTLDVELVDKDNNTITEPLTWVTADGRAQDEVLWEPGCTYNLQSFKIVNNGNLALKYKIQITGIDGDAELNEVIDWTYAMDGKEADLFAEGQLAAKGETGLITITGHMQESANNDYQDKHIDGVTITVIATQDTVEYDSTTNVYDAEAQYPVSDAADVKNAIKNTGIVTIMNDVQLTGGAVKPTTTVVTINAEDEPVTVTFEAAYGIAFTPTSADEEYFANNDEFTLNLNNVTLESGTGGKTSVVFGQYDNSLRLTDKTFNINGGTFVSHSAMTNGAINIAAVSDSTVNISNATFIAYESNPGQYASYIALSDQEAYGAATDIAINFTNCTFMLEDGTVIDPIEIQTSNPSLFARLFWGIGTTNTVNFN